MADVSSLLRALLAADAPKTMGALEMALGLRFDERSLAGNAHGQLTWTGAEGDVVGLSARYAWDMYHEEPATTLARLRARAVLEFTVRLSRGRAAIEAALRERLGAPRMVPGFRVYGHWIVGAEDVATDACTLMHFHELPDWAQAPPDAAVRARFLLGLVAAVAAAETLDAVVAAASSPPPTSGVVFAGATSRDVRLELRPRLAAIELARILGWPNAIGESTDVHQSNWRVKLVVGASAHGIVTAPPVYGRWNVFAALSARPSGGRVAGHPGGPLGRVHLGAGDVVHLLAFGQG